VIHLLSGEPSLSGYAWITLLLLFTLVVTLVLFRIEPSNRERVNEDDDDSLF
jgi:hypothetical protein